MAPAENGTEVGIVEMDLASPRDKSLAMKQLSPPQPELATGNRDLIRPPSKTPCVQHCGK